MKIRLVDNSEGQLKTPFDKATMLSVYLPSNHDSRFGRLVSQEVKEKNHLGPWILSSEGNETTERTRKGGNKEVGSH